MASSFPNLYDYSTDTGMVIPITGDIKNYVQNAMRDIFGAEMDLTDETPAGRLVEALTLMFKNTVGVNAQNLNQPNLQYASGQYLDALANFFGIQRLQPSPTILSVQAYSTKKNARLANGSILQDAYGNQYVVDMREQFHHLDIENPFYGIVCWARSIPEGQYESTQGYVKCLTDGPIVPVATAVSTTMVNDTYLSPAPYLSVVSAAEGSVDADSILFVRWYIEGGTVAGRDTETDLELRQRIASARDSGGSSPQAIANTIWKACPDLRTVRVVANSENSTKNMYGVSIPAHTVVVVCGGITEGDSGEQGMETRRKIAKAIYMSRPAGIGQGEGAILGVSIIYVNNETHTTSLGESILPRMDQVTITDDSTGQNTDIVFYEPASRAIFFSISLKINGYSGSDVKDDIKRILTQYVSGKITDLSRDECINLLSSSISGIFITGFQMSSGVIQNANSIPCNLGIMLVPYFIAITIDPF